MADPEEEALLYKLIKASSIQAVKDGFTKIHLPDDAVQFVASQLSFTFDLIKAGAKLTPAYLSVLLAKKGLGIAKLAAGKRYGCGIAIFVLGASLTKAIGFTTITGPVHLIVVAAELLSDCYSIDKQCGVSDAVSEQIQKVTLPIGVWLERGVVDWLHRGL